MNGFQMAKRIKSHAHLTHIPILLCSGYAGNIIKQPEFSDYFCGYLNKPFKLERLLKAIEVSLAGENTG